jgi:hypothetical protein
MKFYRDINSNDYYWKIRYNKLNVIYTYNKDILFFKNGKYHNSKNASVFSDFINIQFWLNGKWYRDDFTKESWRRFVKLQAFL